MAGVSDEFNCAICQDLLKDPVTLQCGHNYCFSCITEYWDKEEQSWDKDEDKGVYSCPQCRRTFTPRPALSRNTMMVDMLDKLKKAEPQQIDKASAQQTVEEAEKIFAELISFMEQKRTEVTESIRVQERAEVSQAEGLLEQLGREIAKLEGRDVEMEKLLQTEDHIDFLKSFGSCGPAPVSEISSVTFTPNVFSTDVMAPALKELSKMSLQLHSEVKAKVPSSQADDCSLPTIMKAIRTGDRVRLKSSAGLTVRLEMVGVTHGTVGEVLDWSLPVPDLVVQYPEVTVEAHSSDYELVP
ncbi:E3 ubiquitin-protein ligase TRIM58-like isoform X4 [Engraulis encrasicolus]|uniref:E3 ubiquitin-protein ligase TRIM58-like isoform X4 n=1 Tax=Engraulis encrasicolus TaxID=184585 RepID=UPI002FD5947A